MLAEINSTFLQIVKEKNKEIKLQQLEELICDLVTHIAVIDSEKERHEAYKFLKSIASAKL